MELSVVYVERSNSIKNAKLKIVQYLIEQGVFPESIQISNQEFNFKCDPEKISDSNGWCNELNRKFNGQIDFLSKFPDMI